MITIMERQLYAQKFVEHERSTVLQCYNNLKCYNNLILNYNLYNWLKLIIQSLKNNHFVTSTHL